MIADAAKYPGDAKAFVAALIETHWIDANKLIHDWLDYVGRYLEARYRKGNPEKLAVIWRKHGRTSTHESVREIQAKMATSEYGKADARQVPPYLSNLSNLSTNLPGKDVAESIVERWNALAKELGLTQVMKLNDKRKRGIKNRLIDKSFDMEKIFQLIRESDFLQGKIQKPGGDSPWQVDFDFVFCSENNYVKILEGKYRNKFPRTQPPRQVDQMEYLKGKGKKS